MEKILLVSGSTSNIQALGSMTQQLCSLPAETCLTSAEAGQLMESGAYSAMIVNTPLKDSQGIDLCVYVCTKLHYPVLLMTNAATAERVGGELREKGILVMPRPVDKSAYATVLSCLIISGRVASALRKKNAELEDELAERRLVARAKAMLIRYMGMTEDQSHRFIEKQAMDLRLPKREVAQNILKTYYNK